jgi:hypothetical protein
MGLRHEAVPDLIHQVGKPATTVGSCPEILPSGVYGTYTFLPSHFIVVASLSLFFCSIIFMLYIR